ncbi:MAG: polyprenyl synthetase family protein [Candidatus ainarchaeum sp.]|nr:polyprenyl synthetase family protein [Candidatus ainarchaeum sp.]
MTNSEKEIEPFMEYIAKHKQQIYQGIISNVPSQLPEKFGEMVKEYVNRQGKYARPALILLWCELFGGKITKDVEMAASAMQCSEDWVLMHDDLQDGNEVRRGKPAAHILYGGPHSINAGDYLHMVNWKIVFDTYQEIKKTKGEEIAKRYYDKFYNMLLTTSEGQYYDMTLTHSKDIMNFTIDDYFKSIYAKTAYYSVYGPMQMGAILAGADEKTVEGIKKYGIPIGNAFQIKDDLLDCLSTVEVLGKSVGNDIREGVKTPMLFSFVKEASKEDLEKVKAIYAKERENKTEEDVKFVLDMFKKYNSYKYAEDLVDKLGQEAKEAFETETKNINNEFKTIGENAIEKMIKRKK